MDEQNQVEDKNSRLLSAFSVFIAAYASLHKFFLPVALKFTTLQGTKYSEIQPTLILPLALAFLLARQPQRFKIVSFLAGASILFAIYEAYLTAIGIYTGWIAFSRLLSSVPLGLVSVIFLSGKNYRSSNQLAWLGVFGFCLLIFLNEWHRRSIVTEEKTPPHNALKEEAKRALPLEASSHCGAQELLSQGSLTPASLGLRVELCGLTPNLLLLDTQKIFIENITDQPVNLHLVIGDGIRLTTGWNILVRAREKVESKAINIPEGSAGLLYSDTQPQVGVVGLLPRHNTLQWAFSRKPISIKRVP